MTTPPALPSEAAPVRLRRPDDLVTLTPYLIGFHPADDLVLIGFAADRAVVSVRVDLPDARGLAARVDDLLELATRHPLEAIAALGYGPAARTRPALTAVRRAAAQRGLRVLDLLRVEDGRWWSELCPDPGCCPPEGTPVSTDGVVAAQCTFAGLAPAADQQEFEARLAPVSGAERAALQRAADRVEQELAGWLAELDPAARAGEIRTAGIATVEAAIQRYAAGGRLNDEEIARLSLLLVSIPVRDAAWRAIATPEPHLNLWTDVTRRADPLLVAAPASLLAFTAWRAGDGALARLALERALTADPDYPMARLLWQALRHGLPPSILDGWGTPAWQAMLDGAPRREG
ncbi:MAG TPA: DUF4192 domain-containing protein [Natronosporangium sp.]|nr:DUF4192 domain-containing protein [Natronosporangium sp.]